MLYDATLNDAPTTIKFRNFNVNIVETFIEENNYETSMFNNDCLDANDYYQNLCIFPYTLWNKYFPLNTKVKNHKRLSDPWLIKDDILKLIDQKPAWFRIVKWGSITLQSNENYCTSWQDLLRIVREVYSLRKFNSLGK